VAVAGWQCDDGVGNAMPSILSGRNAGIGALLSEIQAFFFECFFFLRDAEELCTRLVEMDAGTVI
jgi:hypothetical protein